VGTLSPPGGMPSAPPAVEDVLSLASTAEADLLAETPPSLLAHLHALGPQLGEALDWAAEHDPERGLGLAAALWRHFLVSGQWQEGKRQLAWLLGLVPAASSARLAGLTSSALLLSFAGAHAEARALAEEAMPLSRALDDELRLGYLNLVMGRSAQAEGDVRTASFCLAAALERFCDAGHPWGTAKGLPAGLP
jgi:hypothetical protein